MAVHAVGTVLVELLHPLHEVTGSDVDVGRTTDMALGEFFGGSGINEVEVHALQHTPWGMRSSTPGSLVLVKILVVTAHPDDVDFGAGGTVRKWILEGHEVVYCLVTDGQAGGSDNTITREEMAAIRRREQTEAAAVLGVTELHFLGFPDGAVVADLNLRREISAVIRRIKPDRLLTQSPERRYDRIYASHPDHLATGEATMCAVYPDARNEFAFPELLAERGLAPHTVAETWIMGGPNPTHFEDVSTTINAKIDALMCHASQHQDPAAMRERVLQWAAIVAEAGGLPAGSLAEPFLIVDTK